MNIRISLVGALGIGAALMISNIPSSHAGQLLYSPSQPAFSTPLGGPQISNGRADYAAADIFTLPGVDDVTSFDFIGFNTIVSNVAGTTSQVDYDITSAPFSGTSYASGSAAVTDTLLGDYQIGGSGPEYAFYNDAFSISPVQLQPNTTYYLNIFNAISSNSGQVYWDDLAYNGTGRSFNISDPDTGYESGFAAFDVYGNAATPAPETSSFYGMLLGAACLLVLSLFSFVRRSKSI